MNEQPVFNYLGEQIQSSIDVLKQKSASNKNKTRWVNGLSIALGALITLTLGLDIADAYSDYQKNLALVFGALLTFVNGWNAFFDYKKLWSRQKSTLLDLYQLRNELGYRSAKEDYEISDLFDKYQRIWEKNGNEWRTIIKTSSNKIDACKKDD